MPVFKGKATLEEGEWQVVTGESTEDMRFFKVEAGYTPITRRTSASDVTPDSTLARASSDMEVESPVSGEYSSKRPMRPM